MLPIAVHLANWAGLFLASRSQVHCQIDLNAFNCMVKCVFLVSVKFSGFIDADNLRTQSYPVGCGPTINHTHKQHRYFDPDLVRLEGCLEKGV